MDEVHMSWDVIFVEVVLSIHALIMYVVFKCLT